MNYDELEKEINSNLKSLYLLYGQEQYLIEMSVKKIKKKFDELVQGINYILIDENNTEEIIPNIEMPAFGYDRKLIIVKNSGLFKKDGRKGAYVNCVHLCDASTEHNLPEIEPEDAQHFGNGGRGQTQVNRVQYGQEVVHGLVETMLSLDHK